MKKTFTTEEFIKKSREVHGNKYDYSKVEYYNSCTKVCIICPEHGEFWQTPNHHLEGQGCKECGKKITKPKLTTENFIKKAKSIHGNRYDYSKVEYVDMKTKVCIICPEHGDFYITPHNHLYGKKCAKCATNDRADKHRNKQEEVINKARKIHNDKYDYSKVTYTKMHDKVCIICSKHGEFWQSMANHIAGKGCPRCKESLLEMETEKIFLEKNILYEKQKQFDWLKYKRSMKLDFYLPEYNIAVECQGLEHFKSIPYFGGDKKFKLRKIRDDLKRKLCLEHNITILYYTNEKISVDLPIFYDLHELINNILGIKTKNAIE